MHGCLGWLFWTVNENGSATERFAHTRTRNGHCAPVFLILQQNTVLSRICCEQEVAYPDAALSSTHLSEASNTEHRTLFDATRLAFPPIDSNDSDEQG